MSLLTFWMFGHLCSKVTDFLHLYIITKFYSSILNRWCIWNWYECSTIDQLNWNLLRSDSSQANLEKIKVLLTRIIPIGHFRVHLSLRFKARLSATSLLWKSVFIHIEIIGTNYHNKNFALTLALKERLRGNRKWPITFIEILHPLLRRLWVAGYSEVALNELWKESTYHNNSSLFLFF